MGERKEVEVEVVLSRDAVIEAMYESDNNPAWPNPCPTRLPVLEGSLTEARLRLADAAEALEAAERKVMNEHCFDEADQVVLCRKAYRAALAALRTARGV